MKTHCLDLDLNLGKMATANPDVAEITCKNPECPKGIFQWNTILYHILRSKNCKVFYHETEVDSSPLASSTYAQKLAWELFLDSN